MIAIRPQRHAGIPARSRQGALAAVVLATALAGSGCTADRETSLLRSSRAREVGAMRSERDRQVRDLEIWRASQAEAEAEIARIRSASIRASSDLRAKRVELLYELDDLQQAERELLAAQQRAAQIGRELAPLRALEQELAAKETRIAQQQRRIAETEQQLAAAVAAAEAGLAALQPRLVAAEERVRALTAAGVTLAEVEQKLQQVRDAVGAPAAVGGGGAQGSSSAPKDE